MDKAKKDILIMSVTITVLLTLVLVLITIYNFSTNKQSVNDIDNDLVYKITYHEMENPKTTYEIIIYNDRVKISKTKDCSVVRCNEKSKETINNYSQENMIKLKKFLVNNFSFDKDNSVELKLASLTKYQEEVINGLILSQYFFEIAVEEYKYEIEYYQNDNTSYHIYLKKDNNIIVKRCLKNSNYDITKIETYNLKFTQNSTNKIYEYVKKELKKDNRYENKVYKYITLRKDEINIFDSITKNDEKYLINNDKAELSYTIEYHGINCLTPKLYLYDNNTYEYYYTFTSGDKALTPKTGTYNFDINKLITNNKNSEYNYYTIKDEKNDKSYNISENNITELYNLLNSINVRLDMCLEQE